MLHFVPLLLFFVLERYPQLAELTDKTRVKFRVNAGYSERFVGRQMKRKAEEFAGTGRAPEPCVHIPDVAPFVTQVEPAGAVIRAVDMQVCVGITRCNAGYKGFEPLKFGVTQLDGARDSEAFGRPLRGFVIEAGPAAFRRPGRPLSFSKCCI